jgi:hypothetical protein
MPENGHKIQFDFMGHRESGRVEQQPAQVATLQRREVARQRAAAAALARQGWTLVAPLLAESASLGNGASRKRCAFAVRSLVSDVTNT